MEVRGGGAIPVPGRERRADLLDAGFPRRHAAHGIELDDGYRQGSVHPGCGRRSSRAGGWLPDGCERQTVIEAMVAATRQSSPSPASAIPIAPARISSNRRCGVFGAAAAVARLRGLPAPRIANAIGIAASAPPVCSRSSMAGADIKRLHAGHAAREGVQAATAGRRWRARAARRDRIAWTVSCRRSPSAHRPMRPLVRPLALPPAVPFGITDCYVKPYACCRHLQPASRR